ncbi:excinuclease ABC subunit UvrC [Ahrensia sp. R2A130]|uniref:excinuclease ABC subunit UvrC n=1 Tax=Ahrensia sp. R2A130 TaxID=744979 RepID=UPI0001E09422|nr:excinuclease ABC subunit UvrC [Ahrensia sp. R2A130]EFL90579.1 excinuclease ABC subunit C [Ahrensia sp. R2A130]
MSDSAPSPDKSTETVERAKPRDSGDVIWEETAPPSDKIGAEVIADFVTRLPKKPGVYRMMNRAGDVLYVGKAKNLKNRVSSYARGVGHGGNRTARMIAETANMEFVTTNTETEALLLEANLIKRLRPRYNVLIRDDKSFPYILLTSDHDAPGLFKFRGARTRKGDYYGPFANAGSVNSTITALQRIFQLRTCTDSFYQNRTRPCLLHQIKRCAGPCTGEVSKDDYADLVKQTKDFLSGRSQEIKQRFSTRMQTASDEMDFELAAIYRDRLAALSHVSGHQGINPQHLKEADIFAIHEEQGHFCIQVFFFRTGQNWGNRAYFPRADKTFEPAEVLEAFVSQFYDDKPVPRMVLTSHELAQEELLAEALSAKAGHKVVVSKPQRGEKRELMEQVARNAREALGRKLSESATQNKLLAGLQEVFQLDRPPRRIEVYDNSHIMGTNAVGGMIVAGPDGFAKNQYRKFNIKDEEITPGDDFGMMKEVFTRRFARLKKENGNESPKDESAEDTMPAWPDLVLIDGGAGQLSACREIMKELDLEDKVTLVGVAKGVDRDAGRERFHQTGKKDFTLPLRDPTLYFIQRLRDEAHRFAIGTHRAKRKKDQLKNPLDEIEGIGPSRKRAILHHFGSAKAAGRAAVEDLMEVDGVSENMARRIHAHFQKG